MTDHGFTRRILLELGSAGIALTMLHCDAEVAATVPCPAIDLVGDGIEPASTAEIEAIAAWVFAVEEDNMVAELRQRLKSGEWTRDSVFAGLLLAGARRANSQYGGGGFHCVLQVAALRYFALRAPSEETLVPLVFGLLSTRRSVGTDTWTLPATDLSRLPGAGGADARLIAAVEAGSLDEALIEVTALARGDDVTLLHDTLLELGSRRAHKLGHEAICAAKVIRVLLDLPGPWAEDVYRAMVYAFITVDAPSGPEHTDVWTSNRAEVIAIPGNWATGTDDPSAIPAIMAALRTITDPLDGANVVTSHLATGLSPATVWDALLVSSAESVFSGANYHAVTSVQALHDAFLIASTDRVRLLCLLQAAAFVPVMSPDVASVSVLDLRGDETGVTLASVFEESGPDSMLRALAYFAAGGDQQAFIRTAMDLARMRADDEHHYKLPHAALLEVERIACAYRPYLLAATRRYAPPGNGTINAAWEMARDAGG